MARCGFTSYDDAHERTDPYEVPIKLATEESLRGFGRIVNDFDSEEVWIVQWPKQGWREICPGTGNEGGITIGDFRCKWNGDLIECANQAVDRSYVTGRLPKNMNPKRRTHVLVRDANYHPDGGQVFFPTTKEPFVLLLAPPGDDIKLEHFVAFYFDGTFGVQILPNIWHQSMYPIEDETVFKNKQGKVHACVEMDTVHEFGKYLLVPLTAP